MAAATSAFLSQIKIIHIEGGEVSGNIDLSQINKLKKLNKFSKTGKFKNDFIFILSLLIIDETDNSDYFLYKYKL